MLVSCGQKEKVALVVINANVYTVDSLMSNVEAFAVKDEKFVAVGTSDEITKKYTSEKIIDLKGKPVYPGFIDAHCHFYGLGLQEQNVDLVGTQSYEEVIQRVVDFQKKRNTDFIVGRGWDQNDWEEKEFPTKEALDSLYPNTPVVLF